MGKLGAIQFKGRLYTYVKWKSSLEILMLIKIVLLLDFSLESNEYYR